MSKVSKNYNSDEYEKEKKQEAMRKELEEIIEKNKVNDETDKNEEIKESDNDDITDNTSKEKYDDYLKLENIILAPDKIIQDRKNNLRMFKCINGKFYEIVIKTTKNKNENYLTTFHRCNISKLKDKKR